MKNIRICYKVGSNKRWYHAILRDFSRCVRVRRQLFRRFVAAFKNKFFPQFIIYLFIAKTVQYDFKGALFKIYADWFVINIDHLS